jgi:hypothetical protein
VRSSIAQSTIHGGASLGIRLEQERQINKPQRRHPVGQVARRLIPEREDAALDQPQDVFGPVAEIHDVPNILDVDPVAEALLQALTDALEGAAEAGIGRPVAGHANGNRFHRINL